MHKTLLIGYLGKDPEMKYTAGGTAIATFTIASTIRRRALPRRRPPRDGKGRTGLIHPFAPLLNFHYRRQNPCRRLC